MHVRSPDVTDYPRPVLTMDADPRLVVEGLVPDPGQLAAVRIHQHDVRGVNGRLALDDAALDLLLRVGLGVALDQVDALDHHPALVRQHAQHAAALAAIAPGDHLDFVVLADREFHHSTSGASEMIFMNRRSRSSRATGPKTRVPIGSFESLTRTAALRSKRM